MSYDNKKYEVFIQIRDNEFDTEVQVRRNSDKETWMWMANTMLDSLAGLGFVIDRDKFYFNEDFAEQWLEEHPEIVHDYEPYGGSD